MVALRDSLGVEVSPHVFAAGLIQCNNRCGIVQGKSQGRLERSLVIGLCEPAAVAQDLGYASDGRADSGDAHRHSLQQRSRGTFRTRMQYEGIRRGKKRTDVGLLAREYHLTPERVRANEILAGATTRTISHENQPRGHSPPRHDGEKGRDNTRDVLNRGKPPRKDECHLCADSEPRPALRTVTTMKVRKFNPDGDDFDPSGRYADTFAQIVLDALVDDSQRRREPPAKTRTQAAGTRLINVED